MRFFDSAQENYAGLQKIIPASFKCGYCNNEVSSDSGYKIGIGNNGQSTQRAGIYICPSCLGPTFRDLRGIFYPQPTAGNDVDGLPDDISGLYSEARACCGVGSYTSAVLSCRKILMHVAVDLGADENKSFIYYVNWMLDNHHIPPKSGKWVDHIREKGNEANHDIVIMDRDEAERLVRFIEMLLKVNYEFPGLIPEDLVEEQQPSSEPKLI
ncbi:MAG: DUF4145 domain-containing protein [Pseudomonadota bacterium]